jgi:hypothetical protein
VEERAGGAAGVREGDCGRNGVFVFGGGELCQWRCYCWYVCTLLGGLLILEVDGGAWRTKVQPGTHIEYPDFLLADGQVTGVKGMKTSKI